MIQQRSDIDFIEFKLAAHDITVAEAPLRIGSEFKFAQPDNVDSTVLGRNVQIVTIDVKTVDGAQEWLADPFSQRKHHHVVIVAIPLDTLTEEFSALDAWQRIISEQAA